MVYVITINDREYEVDAETRWKAINDAANLYRNETGAEFSIPVLMAIARTRKKDGGRKRYPRVVL